MEHHTKKQMKRWIEALEKCPYCGSTDRDWQDGLPDEVILVCNKCGKISLNNFTAEIVNEFLSGNSHVSVNPYKLEKK